MSIRNQLNTMIQLATIDGDFSHKEKEMIFMIGKANGVSEQEMEGMVHNPEPIPVESLTDDEKFEYLYNIVQLMKIDSQVYLSEIKFCEDVAVKLGFNKNVISEMSKRIYSDPSITVDKESLKKKALKFMR